MQERPRPAELGENVGRPFPEGPLALELLLDVLGDRVLVGDAHRHLTVELGELAVLLAEQLLDIAAAVAVDRRLADQRVLGELPGARGG